MEENKKVWTTAIAALAVILLGAAFIYFFVLDRSGKGPEVSEAAEEMITKTPAVEEVTGKEDVAELLDVELDSSDPLIRDLVKRISSNPQLLNWISAMDLIRKFVASVDNIANGQSPRAHLDFFILEDPFKVIRISGREYIDPSSYARYDGITEAFLSLDTEGSVRLFKQLKPLIQEAYRELGYPEQDFQNTLGKAIRELIRVPVVKDVLLQKKVTSYAMANPRLEELSPAQKHLLRMGPENVKKVQSKLSEMARALGVPLVKLGSE